MKKRPVFHVALDGTITQPPFAGLTPTKDHVSDLQAYLTAMPAQSMQAHK